MISETLTPALRDDLLCAYAALVLADGQLAITADKMNRLIEAAGASVPAHYPALYEKVFSVHNIDNLLSVSASAAPSGTGPAPVTTTTAPPVDTKKGVTDKAVVDTGEDKDTDGGGGDDGGIGDLFGSGEDGGGDEDGGGAMGGLFGGDD